MNSHNLDVSALWDAERNTNCLNTHNNFPLELRRNIDLTHNHHSHTTLSMGKQKKFGKQKYSPFVFAINWVFPQLESILLVAKISTIRIIHQSLLGNSNNSLNSFLTFIVFSSFLSSHKLNKYAFIEHQYLRNVTIQVWSQYFNHFASYFSSRLPEYWKMSLEKNFLNFFNAKHKGKYLNQCVSSYLRLFMSFLQIL